MWNRGRPSPQYRRSPPDSARSCLGEAEEQRQGPVDGDQGLCRREFEAAFDPVEPGAVTVEALVDDRDIALHVGEMAVDGCQVMLDGGHAVAELAQAAGEIIELCADCAQVL